MCTNVSLVQVHFEGLREICTRNIVQYNISCAWNVKRKPASIVYICERVNLFKRPLVYKFVYVEEEMIEYEKFKTIQKTYSLCECHAVLIR